MDLERLGGLVTKAVSRSPRAGQRLPPRRRVPGRHAQLGRAGESGSRRRPGGMSCPGWRPNLRRAQVLVNVVGFTVEEYAEVVAGLDGAPGIAGLELNLSCPNTRAGGIEFGADPACVRRIVGLCRARTRLAAPRQTVAGAPRLAGHGAGGAGRRRRRDHRWSTPCPACCTGTAPRGWGTATAA